ncbi:MAG: RluA family pseudouridine synthase [Robiginitalea sp.]
MTREMQGQEDPEEEELFEHYSYTAGAGQEPLRVDKFLMNLIRNATRNKIQKAARDGNIRVNDQIVKQNYKVKPGDTVRVLFEHPPYEDLIRPEDIPLNIAYEDDSLLVVDKPPGMVVHPGHGNYTGTLLNALANHLGNMPMNSDNRPGLVHRIDKDTSGLLVIAKTEHAMSHLARQFFDKTTEREYVALVWGNVEDDKGTVEGAIGRNPKNRLQMQVFPEGEQGKTAITHYEVLERFRYVTLVSCRLETGRTHQIRVHMKYLGHPLFNDERYGGDRILKGTTFSKYRQFVENAFKTGKKMFFQAEIPPDMAACIEKWRQYTRHQQDS